MESAKSKIKTIVETYKKNFPDDYRAVVGYVKEKRNKQKTEFATTEDTISKTHNSIVTRHLLEMPEALAAAIYGTLNSDEYKWFRSAQDSKNIGTLWFAREFPEFRIPENL